MIKCCQNCHYYNRTSKSCESGNIISVSDGSTAGEIWLMLEDGKIHELCEELGLPDDDSESSDTIARFFEDHLPNLDVHMCIKDEQNFCCNAWR